VEIEMESETGSAFGTRRNTIFGDFAKPLEHSRVCVVFAGFAFKVRVRRHGFDAFSLIWDTQAEGSGHKPPRAHTPRMGSSFQPFLSRIGPCITCHYWSTTPMAPGHVFCVQHKIVQGLATGCNGYEREPGSDDEVQPLPEVNELVLQRIRSNRGAR